MNARVLIVGASIAGLTAAHWLKRDGYEVTVVERAPRLRAGGNGVDIRDAAVGVIEQMGIMPQVRAVAADVQGMKFVDADDRAVARVGIDNPGGAVEIMRGDLVALLHSAADVEYIFDDSIRELAQDDDGVTVQFHTAPSRRFDLVLGADGLHSAVRKLAFGPEDRFLQYKDHYFAFANAHASLGEDRWVTMYNEPGKMAGVYRSGNHAQAKAYFIFRSAPIAYDYRDMAAHKQLVADAFGDDAAWRIPDLLAAATDDPEFYFDALSQVHMDSWSSGRIALLGDAAWCASPASGAGAELAIVGAYQLATALAAADGDHRIAFARYQANHRALVDKKQQICMNLGLMVPKTTMGRKVRNTVARLM